MCFYTASLLSETHPQLRQDEQRHSLLLGIVYFTSMVQTPYYKVHSRDLYGAVVLAVPFQCSIYSHIHSLCVMHNTHMHT